MDNEYSWITKSAENYHELIEQFMKNKLIYEIPNCLIKTKWMREFSNQEPKCSSGEIEFEWRYYFDENFNLIKTGHLQRELIMVLKIGFGKNNHVTILGFNGISKKLKNLPIYERRLLSDNEDLNFNDENIDEIIDKINFRIKWWYSSGIGLFG